MGSEGESAARGLWGAVEIYRESAEIPLAIETCRDITALYPDTAYASKAKGFLTQQKPEQIAVDKEKEAKEALTQPSSTPQPTASPSTTPIDSHENPQPKSTKKKKMETNPPKINPSRCSRPQGFTNVYRSNAHVNFQSVSLAWILILAAMILGFSCATASAAEVTSHKSLLDLYREEVPSCISSHSAPSP